MWRRGIRRGALNVVITTGPPATPMSSVTSASLSHRNAVSISPEEMSGSQSLISPDGRWWWDGHRWVPMHRRAAEPDEPGSDAAGPHRIISIQRSVSMKYSRDMEPPEIRARFGTVLGLMGFVLTLPAAGAGTLFSMAVATGQAPPWPTIGEGILIFAVVLGFLGSWPLIGFLVAFGIRDGLRWVFLCLVCSGAVPALFLGGLLIVGAPQANASDLVTMEVALSWLWALPAIGLWLLRATHTGRPLPPAKTFLSMFRSGWRRKLPGRVFGSSGVNTMLAGAANFPITLPTWLRSSFIIEGEPSLPPFRVTNATIAWPVWASLRPATAASATAGWLTSALSTSIVEMRCPETFITSSMRPSSQKSPSSSMRAPSPTKYVSFHRLQ